MVLANRPFEYLTSIQMIQNQDGIQNSCNHSKVGHNVRNLDPY